MVRLLWVEHDDPVMAAVTELRWEVLMQPFGVLRDDDWGDADPASYHLVAMDLDTVIGYSRLIDAKGSGQIRQVAVAFDRQNSGIGSALLAETVRKARELGLHPVFLNARTRAQGFYERLGFVSVTPEPFPYGRTGMPHVRMEARGGV